MNGNFATSTRNGKSGLPTGRNALLWGFNLLLLIVAVVFWQKLRWKKIGDSPSGIVWHRGHTTHVDRNRDGWVDEETIALPNGDKFFRRDTDLDGWLDYRYVERNGLVRGADQIRERVPAH